MDTLTPVQRSQLMSRIKARNTKPEIAVRRMVYGLGFRYRLNYEGLIGRPDLAFVGRRKVIFVHGCFWHWHEGCTLSKIPKTRAEFWQAKLQANRARDHKICTALEEQGWQVLVVWQCELKDPEALLRRLEAFLASS